MLTRYSLDNSIHHLNGDLNFLNYFLSSKFLTVAIGKSICMIFKRKRYLEFTPMDLSHNSIVLSNTITYLGLKFDLKHKWATHFKICTQ